MTMASAEILDLADYVAMDRDVTPERIKWQRLALALLVPLAIFAGTGALRSLNDRSQMSGAQAADRIPVARLRHIAEMNVDDRQQIVAEGLDAEERNARIPSVGVGQDRVAAFALTTTDPSQLTALKCLTQAVYYEAATEPMEGRRAVAQVVLNRVRHPAYPNSVCGVVYQGAERLTGCQFSFTCDGSLLRPPAAKAWREAQLVASEALSGYVEGNVGAATHYHADYVLPRWAFELLKSTQIGRHIFYRFTGAWGQASALSAHYGGNERIPALNMKALGDRLALAESAAAAEQFTPGLTVAPSITDRHAEQDVGGRLDMTREWRLSIPDPAMASSRYRKLVDGQDGSAQNSTQVAQSLSTSGSKD